MIPELMVPLSDVDPTILHYIEFEAGLSSHIVLPEPLLPVAQYLIKQSEARIEEIEARLAEERSRLWRLRAAMAPYKKLPYELLSRIIKETSMLSSDWTFSGYRPNPQTAPWIFRQICSTWRRAALSYYEFWNNLNFWRRSKDNSAILDFWAQHIGDPGRPISIARLGNEDAELVVQKIVIPYHQSLVSLDTVASEAFLSIPPGCFSMLKNLRVDFERKDASYHLLNASCFVGMDGLRSLSLDGYRPSIQLTTVPMNKLTSLTLRYPPLDLSIIIQVLRDCHNSLADLTLWVDINPNTFTEYEKPEFILPHLQSLEFTESISGMPRPLQHKNMCLLNYLTLPSMEALTINLEPLEQDVDYPSVPLISLVERSKCQLDELIINAEFSLRSHSEIPLNNLPSLAVLDAQEIPFSHTTVSRIAAGELIPKITSLQFGILDTQPR